MAVFKINAPILRYAGTQLQAKLLLSSFGVAAAYAQRSYGVRTTDNQQLILNYKTMIIQSQNFASVFG